MTRQGVHQAKNDPASPESGGLVCVGRVERSRLFLCTGDHAKILPAALL